MEPTVTTLNESKPESKPDLSVELEAVALRGMAGVALNAINVGVVLAGADDDITPADAMLVELIAQNVALSAALERMTAERDELRADLSNEQTSHSCTAAEVTFIREDRDRMIEQRDAARFDLERAAKRYATLMNSYEFVHQDRDAERERANLNEQQARLNGDTVQRQARVIHDMESRIFMVIEQLKHDAELMAEGDRS
jgi:predicted nuclease with TOPRIM domain